MYLFNKCAKKLDVSENLRKEQDVKIADLETQNSIFQVENIDLKSKNSSLSAENAALAAQLLNYKNLCDQQQLTITALSQNSVNNISTQAPRVDQTPVASQNTQHMAAYGLPPCPFFQ